MIHLFLGALFLSYDAVQGWNGGLIEAVTDCGMKCAIVVSCSDKNQKMLWHPTYGILIPLLTRFYISQFV